MMSVLNNFFVSEDTFSTIEKNSLTIDFDVNFNDIRVDLVGTLGWTILKIFQVGAYFCLL